MTAQCLLFSDQIVLFDDHLSLEALVVGPILMEHYYMEGFLLLDHAIIHSTG